MFNNSVAGKKVGREDGHILGLRRVSGMAAKHGFLASQREEFKS